MARTTDKRILGKRAEIKRQQFMDCLRELLRTSRYRDITVKEVARLAGSAPGTFYQYFADMDGALVAMAAEVADEAKELRDLILRSDWSPERIDQSAAALVDAFLLFWRRHDVVLRTVDLASLEGDPRYRKIRTLMLNEIAQALALSRQGLAPHDRTASNMAMAGTLAGLLAHISAHQSGFDGWGIKLEDVRASVATLIRLGLVTSSTSTT